MYISDLHETPEQEPEVVERFLSDSRKKAISNEISEIVEAEFERLQDYAAEYISETAAERAKKFLLRILDGDKDAGMALLGDQGGYDRHKASGYEAGEPWAHLIRGELFETDGIVLRRKIVEAHADLLRNERILDLESVVEGLQKQVMGLEEDLATCRDRYHK